MKIKWIIFFLVTTLSITYFIFKVTQPTKIINVYQSDNWVDIVVSNFPMTKNGKLKWWNENVELLKTKYKVIFLESKNRSFHVNFWGVGSGYKSKVPKKDWMVPSVDTSYLICFEAMKVKANCVEKHNLLSISRYRDPWSKGEVITEFSMNGGRYRQYGSGDEIIKVKESKSRYY